MSLVLSQVQIPLVVHDAMSDMVTTSGQQKRYEQHTSSMQRVTNEQQKSNANRALQFQNDGIDKSVGIEHVDHTSQQHTSQQQYGNKEQTEQQNKQINGQIEQFNEQTEQRSERIVPIEQTE